MESIIRVFAIYLFILLALRIVGKRELAEMSPFEFVMIMLIPEIVSQALQREDYSLTNALTGVSTLLLLVFATSVVTFKWKRAEEIISGSPKVIYSHGKFNLQSVRKNQVPLEEIMSEMRQQGLDSLDKVKMIILEPDGKLSYLKDEQASGA